MNFLPAFFGRSSYKRSFKNKAFHLPYEPLESRRLLAATDLRFVTYNSLNFGSNSGDRQDDVEVVFDGLDADVVVIQEISSNTGANTLLAALNGNGNGQQYSRSDFVNGNDTDTVLFYKTDTVDLVSQNYITTSLREIGEYTISVANTLLNVYSVHLKAAQGFTNEQRRLDEATTLRSHLETLPTDREFIVAGDVNFYSSSEPAYQKLTGSEANNDGRVEDLLPANLIGDWHNNPAFASVHSQSTRTASFGGGATGGLDDRFDAIFSSFGLNDNVGLEYVPDSYFVYGNDGQHFNQSIISGNNSVVSAEVAQALHDASDHLPVVADFQVLPPNGSTGVSIFESDGTTSVSEDGSADSYSVVLNSPPTANVTVQVAPNSQIDLGAGAGVPVSLTFTPANALLPQTIAVTAVDDVIFEGAHSGLIQHSTTSEDIAYDGLAVASTNVSIQDNDPSTTPPLVVLNEIYANIPGEDSNREFIEILATPSSPLTNVWLLEIDGDGSNAGVIDNAQNLNSIVSGANGLVLLGDGYSRSNPWGNQVEPTTTLADLEGGVIENGSITFLLVAGFSSAVGIDLDVDNDGQLDFVPWLEILDGVGWSDGDNSSDQVYSATTLTQPGTPDAASRIVGDNQSDSLTSWYNGDITGDPDSVTFGGGSSNLPDGAEITPGAANFGAIDEAFELGDANRDGAVDFLDIASFISILSESRHSDEADINGDGVVDFLDISPFISILSLSR